MDTVISAVVVSLAPAYVVITGLSWHRDYTAWVFAEHPRTRTIQARRMLAAPLWPFLLLIDLGKAIAPKFRRWQNTKEKRRSFWRDVRGTTKGR